MSEQPDTITDDTSIEDQVDDDGQEAEEEEEDTDSDDE